MYNEKSSINYAILTVSAPNPLYCAEHNRSSHPHDYRCNSDY